VSARRIRVVLILALIGAGLLLHAVRLRTAVPGWNERAKPIATRVTPQSEVARRFSPGRADHPGSADYEALARHLMEGFANYRTASGERAHYPGEPSQAGRSADGLEGFSRIFPLAAAWLASGRPGSIEVASGRLDLAQAFARGIAVGTDPNHPAYWGDVGDYSPQLVESADIALGLWLAREQVWARLDATEQARVVAWLSQSLQRQAWDGNWQLFALTVHRALRALGADVSRYDERMQTSWEILRSLYRGQGWFADPPNGFDFYNAWSFHYSLYWLQQMDPGFEPEFIDPARSEFVSTWRHLLGPRGHPLMGRSACYRMAAPVPLLAQIGQPAGLRGTPAAEHARGEALRALDTTWSWFISHGALEAGRVTSGFCGDDPALQASYSGPASCLWSLRSLVMAFAQDRNGQLLDAPRSPLPVELGDFRIESSVPGWTITGSQALQRVELTIEGNDAAPEPPMRRHGLLERLRESIVHAPRRPDNHAALYGRRRYASDLPPGRCTP